MARLALVRGARRLRVQDLGASTSLRHALRTLRRSVQNFFVNHFQFCNAACKKFFYYTNQIANLFAILRRRKTERPAPPSHFCATAICKKLFASYADDNCQASSTTQLTKKVFYYTNRIANLFAILRRRKTERPAPTFPFLRHCNLQKLTDLFWSISCLDLSVISCKYISLLAVAQKWNGVENFLVLRLRWIW